MPITNVSEVSESNELTPPPSAVARSNRLCIDVTIDKLVGVQRSAIVICADFLFKIISPLSFLTPEHFKPLLKTSLSELIDHGAL